MAGAADHNDRGERKHEALDRLTSLYGLTPKVESAIVAAVDQQLESRARALVAPLPTRYSDALPSWLAAGLAGSGSGRPILAGSPGGLLASAEAL